MDEPTPSGRELEILKVLWDLGQGTVRDVYRRMCPNEELAFNTVQTLIRIMDKKGLVKHRARGRTFVYFPQHSRDQETSRFLAHVFDGAMDQCIVSLLRTKNPDPAELKELEKIIAKTRRKKQASKNRGT
jgi:predicted transcriptional regulator